MSIYIPEIGFPPGATVAVSPGGRVRVRVTLKNIGAPGAVWVGGVISHGSSPYAWGGRVGLTPESGMDGTSGRNARIQLGANESRSVTFISDQISVYENVTSLDVLLYAGVFDPAKGEWASYHETGAQYGAISIAIPQPPPCDACQSACQTGCQVSCQTGCQVSCQTGCQVSCQTGCQVSCQVGCEVSCQVCVTVQGKCATCQSCNACQVCNSQCYACNMCQSGYGARDMCSSCYVCQACYNCYSCNTCQVNYQKPAERKCSVCDVCQSCVNCQSYYVVE